MNSLPVQIGQRFSFEVYPSAVLGNNFKNVRLVGTFDARVAQSFGEDIVAMHANVYPTLPTGTVPNDAFQYNYFRIQYPNGEFQLLGIPWVRQDSIVVATSGRLTLVFDDVSPTDQDRIIVALSSNGYKPNSMEMSTS